MPYLKIGTAEIYYESTGDSSKAPIVFSHGFLWNTRLFDAQVKELGKHFRCVAYDHRGQGKSSAPGFGTISLETNFSDAVTLIEKLNLGPCHFVGLSMGGYTGLRVAARRPDLIKSLTLIGSAAGGESAEKLAPYKKISSQMRFFGFKFMAPRLMPILFGQNFLNDPSRANVKEEWFQRLAANKRKCYRSLDGIIGRTSVIPELAKIKAPTLILVGNEDLPNPPEKAALMQVEIKGSKLICLSKGGHTLTVEQPSEVTQSLFDFINGLE